MMEGLPDGQHGLNGFVAALLEHSLRYVFVFGHIEVAAGALEVLEFAGLHVDVTEVRVRPSLDEIRILGFL